MTIKVIIFDFDGTVADTFDALLTISNNLASEFGYTPTSPEEISQIKDLTTREIIRRSGVAVYKIPFLLRKVISELNSKIHVLYPVEGMKTALFELKKQGNKLGIITSNDQENVRIFLQNNGLLELFTFIYGGTRIFGKSRVINSFLHQANLCPEEVIYVGDETRDIEAAKKSNIKIIAVSWGFNSQNILKQQNPDFLIEHPQQLLEVIKLLQNPPN